MSKPPVTRIVDEKGVPKSKVNVLAARANAKLAKRAASPGNMPAAIRAVENAVAKYNDGVTNPDDYFVKNSEAQKKMLNGEVTFPLKWAMSSDTHPGAISKQGVESGRFFRRALKTDPAFAWQLYELEIIPITTDVLYDCCDLSYDVGARKVALDIAESILDCYEELPVGEYWKRSITVCLTTLMLREFDAKVQRIAEKLIASGGNINTPHVSTHVLQCLVQQYHAHPKNLTPAKLEFMFEHGLNMKSAFSSTSGISFVPPQIDLMYLFTNGIPLDEYIEMLQIIKKYVK